MVLVFCQEFLCKKIKSAIKTADLVEKLFIIVLFLI